MKKNIDKYKTILGIIGSPLKQTMSPFLHNYWFKTHKINSHYTAFNIQNLNHINNAIKLFNIIGLNVTIPHKVNIIKYLDVLEDNAKNIGAVNTIHNNKGKLIGYNTDIYGFEKGLNQFKNLNVEKPIVLIGAGGSAESIVYALKKKGAKSIYLMNRSEHRAKKLEDKYNIVKCKKWLDYDYLNQADLIINSTSLGMKGNDSLVIKFKNLKANVKIYDIVYNPLKTKFIKDARRYKKQNVSGLTMFLYQAQKSFQIWFRKKPLVGDELFKKVSKAIK